MAKRGAKIIRFYVIEERGPQDWKRVDKIASLLPAKNRKGSMVWVEKGSADEDAFLQVCRKHGVTAINRETRRCARLVRHLKEHRYYYWCPTVLDIAKLSAKKRLYYDYRMISKKGIDICIVQEMRENSPLTSEEVGCGEARDFVYEYEMYCSSRFLEAYRREGWTGLAVGDEIEDGIWRVDVEPKLKGPVYCDRLEQDQFVEELMHCLGRRWVDSRSLVDADVQKFTDWREHGSGKRYVSPLSPGRIISARMLEGICVEKMRGGTMDLERRFPAILRFRVVETEETVGDLV